MRLLALSGFGLVAFASVAHGQDAPRNCRVADGETKATVIAAAINCVDEKAEATAFSMADQVDVVNTLREQLSSAQTALTNLQQQVTAQAQAGASFNAQALLRIEALENELKPFRTAKGAVVAFDRSEGVAGDVGGACPQGWSYFEPAGGRMIVGAGNRHENKDMNGNRLTRYAALQDDVTAGKKDSTGGEEKHVLSKPEMPKHRHAISTSHAEQDIHDGLGGASILGQPDFGIDSVYEPNAVSKPGWPAILPNITEEVGGNQPHNNMPPYVALYYCKRD